MILADFGKIFPQKVPHSNVTINPISCILEPELTDTAFRKNWARLIQKIYEVDPLIYSRCNGPMRVISFIEDEQVIPSISGFGWRSAKPSRRQMLRPSMFFANPLLKGNSYQFNQQQNFYNFSDRYDRILKYRRFSML